MTSEQKEYLMAKMIDQPCTLTDSEVQAILSDKELRELYDTAVRLRQTATSPKAYDVDKEWESFKPRLTKRRILSPKWRKWAAIAAILVGMEATATIVRIALQERQEAAVEQTESRNTPEKTYGKKRTVQDEVAPEEDIRLKEPLSFTNVKLKDIAKKVAEVFQCEVKIMDDKKEKLRLYLNLPVGSILADFVAVIDAYDVLNAELQDGVVIIK